MKEGTIITAAAFQQGYISNKIISLLLRSLEQGTDLYYFV